MKLKDHIIIYVLLLFGVSVFSQQAKLKKADTLFNQYAYVKAIELYKELVQDNYNKDYAIRQLADSYSFLRDPRNASRYYKQAVRQANIPIEYYYNYAQSLRGIRDYRESRVWLKRYKDSGGALKTENYGREGNFVENIKNAKQEYFLNKVRFNSKYSDFGAFEHDGKIYFASTRDEGTSVQRIYNWDEQPFLDVYVIDKDAKKVDHHSKLKGEVNSIFHDGPVALTKDGKTMYFSRNNVKENIKGSDKDGFNHIKIYRATKKGDRWINIEELSINNDNFSVQHPALNEDETKLYFASDMPGGYGGSDIYRVDIYEDGTFGTPENLGPIVNTKNSEGTPFINGDGTLFFASDGHEGLGLLDIFGTIENDENKIIDVLNLGEPVNSNSDDFSFFMNPDGLSGYFSSDRRGGRGSDDIYSYYRIPLLHVEGVVTDAINNRPIPYSEISLLDAKDKQITKIVTDDYGYFSINVDRNSDYKIIGKQKKYIDDYRVFTTRNLETKTQIIKTDLLLNPLQDVVVLAELKSLNTIYFDYDSHIIRKDAKVELDKIVNLMNNEYPNMIIRIESHTDSRGSLTYNDRLSIDRANATYQYLISRGIDPKRITEHKGFGKRRLTNGCEEGANCEESDHQLNRRTQFIIVKME
ncbi:OmpA family protein [Mariniflexile ostreae]|uniref:OmpA family protein n=1 Tax=Mariniflexile ostreae TaxID=1520892 RepID=A0ABV5FAW5_9FLAO